MNEQQENSTPTTTSDDSVQIQKMEKSLRNFYGLRSKVVALTDNLSREDWLKIRKQGVGGSEIGAILGHSKYKCAVHVWLDKTGREDKLPEVTAEQEMILQSGKDMEELILELYKKKTGRKAVRVNAMLCHPDEPRMMVNLDAIAQREDGTWGVLEIKNTFAQGDEWKGGKVPEAYQDQCRQGMMVAGLMWGEVISLRAGRWTESSIFKIERDPLWDDRAMSAIEEFWSFVEADVQPKLDSSVGEEGMRMWREALILAIEDGTAPRKLVADKFVTGAISRLRTVQEQFKMIKAEEDSLKSLIADALGGPGTVESEAGTVTWTRNKDSLKFDKDKFKEENPELYSKYEHSEKGAMVMRVKK